MPRQRVKERERHKIQRAEWTEKVENKTHIDILILLCV